jgi:hypothetical protein
MTLHNWNRIPSSSLADEIGKRLKLNWEDKEFLEEILKEYMILEQAKKEVASPFYRLTFPFYFMFLVLLTLVACLKWILTGKYYYTADGKVMNFMKNWIRKINP